MPQTKQLGRRYGPPPRKPRGPGGGPMDNVTRAMAYADQNFIDGRYGVLTARQERQLRRRAVASLPAEARAEHRAKKRGA